MIRETRRSRPKSRACRTEPTTPRIEILHGVDIRRTLRLVRKWFLESRTSRPSGSSLATRFAPFPVAVSWGLPLPTLEGVQHPRGVKNLEEGRGRKAVANGKCQVPRDYRRRSRCDPSGAVPGWSYHLGTCQGKPTPSATAWRVHSCPEDLVPSILGSLNHREPGHHFPQGYWWVTILVRHSGHDVPLPRNEVPPPFIGCFVFLPSRKHDRHRGEVNTTQCGCTPGGRSGLLCMVYARRCSGVSEPSQWTSQ